MSQSHVYVKIRMIWSEAAYGGGDRAEVWGVVLAPPEGATQASAALWRGEEDGRTFEYHGPVPVPGN